MPVVRAADSRRLAASALVLALVTGLFWAYWPTVRSLVERWSTDTRYSHGFIVPVLALIVLWYRRDQLAGIRFQPSWWGVPPLLLAAALRMIDAYYFYHWLDEVSLAPCIVGLCLLIGGWPALRGAWPALVFVAFLLPLPYQLEVALAHPLQRLATNVATYVIQLLGMPAIAEGNIILIDDLKIGVVEACSGLGMLVTFFALSTATAFIIQRPLLDRIIVFLSAIPIGVLANLVRITLTAILHRTAGSYLANLVFHDLAGWLMMPLALGFLALELKLLTRLLVRPGPERPLPIDFSPVLLPSRPESLETPATAPQATSSDTSRDLQAST
jgi:exosortase